MHAERTEATSVVQCSMCATQLNSKQSTDHHRGKSLKVQAISVQLVKLEPNILRLSANLPGCILISPAK